MADWGLQAANAWHAGARNVKRTQFAPGQEAPPRRGGRSLQNRVADVETECGFCFESRRGKMDSWLDEIVAGR